MMTEPLDFHLCLALATGFAAIALLVLWCPAVVLTGVTTVIAAAIWLGIDWAQHT